MWFGVCCRTVETKSMDDGSPEALARRSQAVGVLLTILLLGLAGFLLGLLLRKRERR